MKEIITSPYLIIFREMTRTNTVHVRNLLTEQDRSIETLNCALLKECLQAKEPAQIIHKYGYSCVSKHLAEKFLIDADLVWMQHNYEQAEIEIGTQCDFNCVFCPVSFQQKKKKLCLWPCLPK